MSTNFTAVTLEPPVGRIGGASAQAGFWRRLFNRLIEARMAHGEAHVRAYLNGLSDERLADLGFTPDRIKAVRARMALSTATGCNPSNRRRYNIIRPIRLS